MTAQGLNGQFTIFFPRSLRRVLLGINWVIKTYCGFPLWMTLRTDSTTDLCVLSTMLVDKYRVRFCSITTAHCLHFILTDWAALFSIKLLHMRQEWLCREISWWQQQSCSYEFFFTIRSHNSETCKSYIMWDSNVKRCDCHNLNSWLFIQMLFQLDTFSVLWM